MSFESLFPDKGAALAERWLGLIMETYPDDASGFLKKEQDRFRNPVGYTIGNQSKFPNWKRGDDFRAVRNEAMKAARAAETVSTD